MDTTFFNDATDFKVNGYDADSRMRLEFSSESTVSTIGSETTFSTSSVNL